VATWRSLITAEMTRVGESWDDVCSVTVGNYDEWACPDCRRGLRGSLDDDFDDGLGRRNGCLFTLWTNNRVYFPAQYDGSEWVASAPRNPCAEATDHVGGG